MATRRDILAQRLTTFVRDKILNPHLPQKIKKVMGFGSFFRGKECPGDIDLVVILDGNPFDPEGFKEWRDKSHDVLFENDGKVKDVLETHFPTIPPNVLEWLASYSRTDLNPMTLRGQLSLGCSMDITKRMLKGVPGIKVMQIVSDEKYLEKMRPYTLVWSFDRPNVEDNINLSNETIEENLIKELENLWGQLHFSNAHYPFTVFVLQHIYKYEASNFDAKDRKNLEDMIEDRERLLYSLGERETPSVKKLIRELKDKGLLSDFVEWLRKKLKLIKTRNMLINRVAYLLVDAKQGRLEEIGHVTGNMSFKSFGGAIAESALEILLGDITGQNRGHSTDFYAIYLEESNPLLVEDGE